MLLILKFVNIAVLLYIAKSRDMTIPRLSRKNPVNSYSFYLFILWYSERIILYQKLPFLRSLLLFLLSLFSHLRTQTV